MGFDLALSATGGIVRERGDRLSETSDSRPCTACLSGPEPDSTVTWASCRSTSAEMVRRLVGPTSSVPSETAAASARLTVDQAGDHEGGVGQDGEGEEVGERDLDGDLCGQLRTMMAFGAMEPGHGLRARTLRGSGHVIGRLWGGQQKDQRGWLSYDRRRASSLIWSRVMRWAHGSDSLSGRCGLAQLRSRWYSPSSVGSYERNGAGTPSASSAGTRS
ncbi:MAG: hypothetical protein QOJ59_5470 [Thermomicrobiales bacterium]|nr:hypothetical protein [Thermomicrobiales bacterium]MEA2524503.1 hypothetical protein [Thermomicrobiales bacterium]